MILWVRVISDHLIEFSSISLDEENLFVAQFSESFVQLKSAVDHWLAQLHTDDYVHLIVDFGLQFCCPHADFDQGNFLVFQFDLSNQLLEQIDL